MHQSRKLFYSTIFASDKGGWLENCFLLISPYFVRNNSRLPEKELECDAAAVTFIVQTSQDVVCIVREKPTVIQHSGQHLSNSWTTTKGKSYIK